MPPSHTATGVAGLASSVEPMNTTQDIAAAFFDDYTQALLDRDTDRMSSLYAVPALIAFPHQSIAVTDADQTRQFFDQSWGQYEGVTTVDADVTVVAETGHAIWARVVWSHDGEPREAFIYQLLRDGDTWKVAVLTPLDLTSLGPREPQRPQDPNAR